MKKDKHPSDDLNELEDWIDNQYNPGYYTGGRVSPHVKKIDKVIIMFVVGLISLLISFVIGGYLYTVFENQLLSGISTIISLIIFLGGYFYFKYNKEEKNANN